MVAMDVVKENDPHSLDPVRREAIVQEAFYQGMLLLGCGESAIRFCPPLCISAAQIETTLRILDEVLTGTRKKVAVKV
jgi:4-aminobutyrate aminotransferase